MKIVERGVLKMAIDRRPDAVKSQRLINVLLEAKREDANTSVRDLEMLAQGFKKAQRG